MNFLEQIGLVALIVLGIYLLGVFLEALKKEKKDLEAQIRVNEKALADWLVQEEEENVIRKENKVIAKAIADKQNAFLEKWKDVDPEEEFLIRIGKKKSPLFDTQRYEGYSGISPWGSSVKREEGMPSSEKTKQLIKIADITNKYGIRIDTLELLYRGYSNEYSNDERQFSDLELKIGLVENWFPPPTRRAKSNLHQITLNRIVETLEELREIGIAKGEVPIYRRLC